MALSASRGAHARAVDARCVVFRSAGSARDATSGRVRYRGVYGTVSITNSPGHRKLGSVPGTGGRRRLEPLAAAQGAYPWRDEDYHRVDFMPAPYGPIIIYNTPRATGINGVLCFRLAEDTFPHETTPALEVFVSGDTALSIYQQVSGTAPERPMVHDLLWSVLQRGQAISKRDWRLVRAAIVDVRDDIFIGRLFFGDPSQEGEQMVMWDCDSRPSDACWLALKAQAPIYVHRKVWANASTELRQTHTYQAVQMTSKARMGGSPMDGSAAEASRLDAELLKLRGSDALQLLFRELEVALKEEDYRTCVRIRDHPYMKLYNEVVWNQQLGLNTAARGLLEQLSKLIETNNTASRQE